MSAGGRMGRTTTGLWQLLAAAVLGLVLTLAHIPQAQAQRAMPPARELVLELDPVLTVALVGMVVCSGAMLAPLIGIYIGLGMASTVAAAGIVTAVTFTALTAVVFFTGQNFGFMGKFLVMALFAFIAARMVGILFATSAGLDWWMAALGAVLFCAFILFHTSSVVHFYGPNNMIVPAVIALYLDILNLFLLILQLLSSRERR